MPQNGGLSRPSSRSPGSLWFLSEKRWCASFSFTLFILFLHSSFFKIGFQFRLRQRLSLLWKLRRNPQIQAVKLPYPFFRSQKFLPIKKMEPTPSSKSDPQGSISKDIAKDKAEKKEMKRLAAELALGKELNAKAIEYESLRKLYKERTSPAFSSTSGAISFLAIDFETWESGTNRSDMTLEVGWSVATTHKGGLDSSKSSLKQHTFHFVNEDLLHLRNGRFVADHRDEFIFGPNYQNGRNSDSSSNSDLEIRTALGDSFGKLFNSRSTRIAKSGEIGSALNHSINHLKNLGPLFVVFHDSQGGERL